MKMQKLTRKTIYSEDGERFTRFTFFGCPYETTDEEIDKWVKARFPAERCTHDYDCCGRFYPSAGLWSPLQSFCDEGRMIVVEQSFSLNI